VAVRKTQFRRVLLTFDALADLGPVLTGERDFASTSQQILSSVMDPIGAKEGALFSFAPEPAVLRSVGASGYAPFADPAIIPLTPKHVQALAALTGPENLGPGALAPSLFFSANGNVTPDAFRCIVSLKMRGSLVGVLALGRRDGDSPYGDDEHDALHMVSHYIALALHNHVMAKSLEERTTDNLRVLTSVHDFYDGALQAFAIAVDAKHTAIKGHSLRVGRYAASIAEALGLDEEGVTGLRSGGYLHDIGKLAVDKRLFAKPAPLDPEEFREVADHTTAGHRIVSGIHFPWPEMHEIVRNHHERADGSGYPDKLHADDVSQPTRIIAVADTFDAMITERPYRQPYTVGAALSEIVAATPQKFDPVAVQGLLIQLRREACGSNQFLEQPAFCNLGATDIDQLASALSHRLTAGRVYSA
jgi:putative nucleotidyltransferase with HDIG domain